MNKPTHKFIDVSITEPTPLSMGEIKMVRKISSDSKQEIISCGEGRWVIEDEDCSYLIHAEMKDL